MRYDEDACDECSPGGARWHAGHPPGDLYLLQARWGTTIFEAVVYKVGFRPILKVSSRNVWVFWL